MDSNGHVLSARWAEYEKMQRADRPQKEAEILKEIRDEALRKHLCADFYDAGRQYVYTVQRRDWKLQDSLRTEFKGWVERFDEPIVTYTWMDRGNSVTLEFNYSASDESVQNTVNSIINSIRFDAGH